MYVCFSICAPDVMPSLWRMRKGNVKTDWQLALMCSPSWAEDQADPYCMPDPLVRNWRGCHTFGKSIDVIADNNAAFMI